ncbi:hypothetical protein JCM10213_002718 [Rhodosporidiobolus nylandii]
MATTFEDILGTPQRLAWDVPTEGERQRGVREEENRHTGRLAPESREEERRNSRRRSSGVWGTGEGADPRPELNRRSQLPSQRSSITAVRGRRAGESTAEEWEGRREAERRQGDVDFKEEHAIRPSRRPTDGSGALPSPKAARSSFVSLSDFPSPAAYQREHLEKVLTPTEESIKAFNFGFGSSGEDTGSEGGDEREEEPLAPRPRRTRFSSPSSGRRGSRHSPQDGLFPRVDRPPHEISHPRSHYSSVYRNSRSGRVRSSDEHDAADYDRALVERPSSPSASEAERLVDRRSSRNRARRRESLSAEERGPLGPASDTSFEAPRTAPLPHRPRRARRDPDAPLYLDHGEEPRLHQKSREDARQRRGADEEDGHPHFPQLKKQRKVRSGGGEEKRPVWKRWYVWVGVVAGLGVAIGVIIWKMNSQ